MRVHVGSSVSPRFARASSDAKNRVRPQERQTTTVNFAAAYQPAETRQVVRRMPAAGADFLASILVVALAVGAGCWFQR